MKIGTSVSCVCLSFLGALAFGCNDASGDESVAKDKQPVYHGQDSTNLASGVVQVSGPGGGCTGTIYSEYWVLTAAHCIANSDADNDGQISPAEGAGGYWVGPGPDLNNQPLYLPAQRIFKHPNAVWGTTAGPDAVMIWLGGSTVDGFSIDNLSHYNYQGPWTATGSGRPIPPTALNVYYGSNQSLLNQQVWNFGYGGDGNGNGYGTLRSGWKTILTQYGGGYTGSGYTVCPGDSGGPDFWWSGSAYYVTGIHSSGDQSCGGGMDWQFGAESWRDWAGGTFYRCPDITARTKCSRAQNVYTMGSAYSNNVLSTPSNTWVAANAVDRNTGTSYSSNFFASSSISYGAAWLAAWLSAPQSVNVVVLTARMVGGRAQAFPPAYDVYLTSSDNSQWNLIGHYTNQPRNVQATIQLPAEYSTYGVLVMPTELGADDYGGHYFQMAEVELGHTN